MANETKSWGVDTEIVAAINEIRYKDRKMPYCSTITAILGKKNFTANQTKLTMLSVTSYNKNESRIEEEIARTRILGWISLNGLNSQERQLQ